MKYKKLSDLNISELRSKIINTKKSFASMIKAIDKNKKLLDNVNQLISKDFLNQPMDEKLYSIKYNLKQYPKCKICGENSRFKSKEWSNYCNGNCGYIDRWNNITESEKDELFKKLSRTHKNKTKKEKEKIKRKRKRTCIKRYGVNHNFKITSVIKNRKETWLKNYGFDNPNKSNKIKQKIKETNIKKYGYSCPLLNKKIKNKSNNTLYNNYGVDNPGKSLVIKNKIKNIFIQKYGHNHFMQNVDVFNRITKSMFKYKDIELNGITHKVQGYEDIAIKFLINKGINENSFITNDKEISNIIGSIIWYDNNNIKHRYYPDFYIIENNTLYEIKSQYTYDLGITDGSLNKKLEACKNNGLTIKLLVFDRNGNLIKER